jgi:hypothetical protein
MGLVLENEVITTTNLANANFHNLYKLDNGDIVVVVNKQAGNNTVVLNLTQKTSQWLDVPAMKMIQCSPVTKGSTLKYE